MGEFAVIFFGLQWANFMHLLRFGPTASAFGQSSAKTERILCETTLFHIFDEVSLFINFEWRMIFGAQNFHKILPDIWQGMAQRLTD